MTSRRRRSVPGATRGKRRDVPGGERRDVVRPAAIERPRAAGVLAGMALFCLGFLVAGGFVLTGSSGTPPYLIAVTLGLVGVGVVGFFAGRGTTPMPATPLYSRATLRALCAPLGLPATAVIATLYGLAGLGVVCNIAIPVLFRR